MKSPNASGNGKIVSFIPFNTELRPNRRVIMDEVMRAAFLGIGAKRKVLVVLGQHIPKKRGEAAVETSNLFETIEIAKDDSERRMKGESWIMKKIDALAGIEDKPEKKSEIKEVSSKDDIFRVSSDVRVYLNKTVNGSVTVIVE